MKDFQVKEFKSERLMRNFIILSIFINLWFVFFLPLKVFAYERVVVLYPAVTPILVELGVSNLVVGTTRKDDVLKDVIKVGSHLRPNIELLNALSPDLIIAGSRRAFPEEMEKRVNSDIFYYNPSTLGGIIKKIEKLGVIFKRKEESINLVKNLRNKISNLIIPENKPTIIYEVMAEPLRVAGSKSIVTSIIKTAGGRNLIDINRKHVVIGIEKIIQLNPDIYIFQIGPMNKNPISPNKRDQLRSLKSEVLRVDELEFARPGINAFDAVLKLNRFLLKRKETNKQ